MTFDPNYQQKQREKTPEEIRVAGLEFVQQYIDELYAREELKRGGGVASISDLLDALRKDLPVAYKDAMVALQAQKYTPPKPLTRSGYSERAIADAMSGTVPDTYRNDGNI